MNIFFRINFSGCILTSTHPYFLTILFSCFFGLLCNRRFTSWMVNYVMLSYPYGKTFPRNVSNTLLNLCHKQANEMPVNVYHNYSMCMCVCKPLHSTKPTNWMLGHEHVQYMLGQVYIIYLLKDARPSFSCLSYSVLYPLLYS